MARQRSIKAVLTARDAALQTLLRVDEGVDVQEALNKILQAAHALDQRDTALCTELVYGSLRAELRLRFVLSKLAAKPEKLPTEVQRSVLLALYELLFLPRVQQHAVVHAAVERTNQRFGKSLGGVVNGVLRSAQRRLPELLHKKFYGAADPQGNTLTPEALYYSIPLWLAELWCNAYGCTACLRLLKRSSTQPWPALRLNPWHAQYAALRDAFLTLGAEPLTEQGLFFPPRQSPAEVLGLSLRLWHEQGAFSWQAAGSQQVMDLLIQSLPAESLPLPWWDACAGQGGKTLALLERSLPVGLCSDMNARRLRLLRATADRLGLTCPPLLRMSASQPALQQWHGNILLDVPCSGLGTLARRPEIALRRTTQDFESLIQTQTHILDKAWHMLAPGAVLAYMTCTLNPAENESQVQRLRESHANAVLLLEWQTPHNHPWLEGMYLALLQKH